MYSFFGGMKAAKKSFHEHVKEVWRRYGVPKVTTKMSKYVFRKHLTTVGSQRICLLKKLLLRTSLATKQNMCSIRNSPHSQISYINQFLGSFETHWKAKLLSPISLLFPYSGSIEGIRQAANTGWFHELRDRENTWQRIRLDVRSVWQGLMAYGYDLHFDRLVAARGSFNTFNMLSIMSVM